MLNIIAKDEYANIENEIAFKKYFGMNAQELLRQNEYDFSEFLSRVLLYTTLGGIKNEKGKNCIDKITEDFVNKCTNTYTDDYQWDSDTQLLKIPYLNIFNIFCQAIKIYNVDRFITEVDSTVHIEEKWIEVIDEFDGFRELINYEIIAPYKNNSSEMTADMVDKIKAFYQSLREYDQYLKQHMIPFESTCDLPPYEAIDNEDRYRLKIEQWMKQNREKPTLFIPMFRDENMAWYSCFIKEVKIKRETLCEIFDNISQMADKFTIVSQ